MSKTVSATYTFSEKILLACGLMASLLYLAMLAFIPMLWPGYSSASQTVSELSAIASPTRVIWFPIGITYALLITAFGYGIWKTADMNHPLRLAGGFLLVYGVLCIFWPPMHQREALAAGAHSLTDTLHFVFTMITVFLMMIALGFGAISFGKRFRIYSFGTMLIVLVLVIITGTYASAVAANLPTPMAGVFERIYICVFLLWVMVLSVMLLREENNMA